MINRKFRGGDVVSIRAVVKYDQDDDDAVIHVLVSGYSSCAVDLDEVTAFIQPAVNVDEVVRLSDDYESTSGTVKAVVASGGATFLMVETAPGRMETWAASHIEVVPPPPPAKND